MMVKQLFQELGFGFWAEMALVLFLLAFVLTIVHTLLRRSSDVKSAARLPLDD